MKYTPVVKNLLIGLLSRAWFLAPAFSGQIEQAQEAVIIKAHTHDDPKLPQFRGMDTEFVTKQLSSSDKEKLREQILKQNPGRCPETIAQESFWDVKFYNKVNLPLVVGTIVDQNLFSAQLDGHGLRFLDLPIYMPNQGWRIPPQLEQFKELIQKVVTCERLLNPDFEKDQYVYITVDQGTVPPHTAQRRAGWHGDSYRKIASDAKEAAIPVDHLYVVANACPTPFVPGPFPLHELDPEDIEQVLGCFSRVANGQDPVTYPNYTILRMDPYCVHDVGVNETDQPIHRTFVKISISPSKYCKLGNARNQLFVYDWPMLPRYNVPYTPEALKQSAHRKDRDRFQEVHIRQINFMKTTSSLPWIKSKILTIVRKNPVQAEKAKPGEVLQSRSDDFLVTVTAAEEKDWKVTSEDGYQVFVNEKIFQNLYKADPDRSGYFLPKKEIRRAVEVAEDIRFLTPTGILEYAQKGSYIIYLNEDDIYTVPNAVFRAKYQIIE